MSDRSSTEDHIEGMGDEIEGRAKQAWGDVTGDDRAKAEGMMDEAKGEAKQAWADVKDAADDLKDDLERATR